MIWSHLFNFQLFFSFFSDAFYGKSSSIWICLDAFRCLLFPHVYTALFALQYSREARLDLRHAGRVCMSYLISICEACLWDVVSSSMLSCLLTDCPSCHLYATHKYLASSSCISVSTAHSRVVAMSTSMPLSSCVNMPFASSVALLGGPSTSPLSNSHLCAST